MKHFFRKKEIVQDVKPLQMIELNDTDIKLIVQVLFNYFSQISNLSGDNVQFLRERIKSICDRLQSIQNKTTGEN